MANQEDAVEGYISAVAEPAQSALRELRAIIRAVMPKEATEVLSYGLPAFSLGKAFFGYAAFKTHLSIVPFSGSFLDDFAEDLKGYSRTKSILHLSLDKPLPKALIRKLARARLASLPAPRQKKSLSKKPLS